MTEQLVICKNCGFIGFPNSVMPGHGLIELILWLCYSPPVDVEYACLEGICTHIGLVPSSKFPGGLPIFLFKDKGGQQLLLRAPLGAMQEQVQAWVAADSNTFMFILIERGSAIIRQIRTMDVPQDFRQYLAKAWMSIKHPVDMRRCNSILAGMTDQDAVNSAVLWAYNPQIDNFEKKAHVSA